MKRETASLIVAAQNHLVKGINLVKAKIDKTQKDTLCRLCKKADKRIDHVVSGCSKLAQKEYKRRHHNLGKIRNLLESVILKLEISGMNISQKVF